MRDRPPIHFLHIYIPFIFIFILTISPALHRLPTPALFLSSIHLLHDDVEEKEKGEKGHGPLEPTRGRVSLFQRDGFWGDARFCFLSPPILMRASLQPTKEHQKGFPSSTG